ncbi:MAG: MotE family protein [Planctomycetota bacterium]|jgi:flagellar motility protein MotE (MotC chaperone)
MLTKKRLFILIGLTLVFFVVSFAATFFLGGSTPAEAQAQAPQVTEPTINIAVTPEAMKPREKELEELIKEVRHKIAVCRQRERELDEREKRIEMALGELRKQAEHLEDLRIKLINPLANLKGAQEDLKRTRIQIMTQELANLRTVVAAIEKMEVSAAAEMLTEMCDNRQQADAVKILYLMSDRKAGKILAEIPDRGLSASLVEKMKRVEQEG